MQRSAPLSFSHRRVRFSELFKLLLSATFDSLLQEALTACSQQQDAPAAPAPRDASQQDKVIPIRTDGDSLPVVVSPAPESASEA